MRCLNPESNCPSTSSVFRFSSEDGGRARRSLTVGSGAGLRSSLSCRVEGASGVVGRVGFICGDGMLGRNTPSGMFGGRRAVKYFLQTSRTNFVNVATPQRWIFKIYW